MAFFSTLVCCTRESLGVVAVALIDFVLTQECTIYPWLRQYNGEDVYGEPETRRCRILVKKKLEQKIGIGAHGVLDMEGSNAKMFCTGDPIKARSKVECEDETFIVIDCYRARGFVPDHLEVVLQ